MANTIHILNGDAPVPEFKKSGIAGDIAVWREILCEGPVSWDIQGESFWQQRAQFIKEQFGGDYDIMQSQLEKMRHLSQYDEVVLWFEYDLFCQVNLMASINFIDHKRISLVCLGDELDGTLRGLGEITAKDFIGLFEDRVLLTSGDRAFAKKVWYAYTDPSSELLRQVEYHGTFPHLEKALWEHMFRFPMANGLNRIEQKMLRLVEEGVSTKNELVGKMLRSQGYLGFGDSQYFRYLDQLQDLLEVDRLVLSDLGKAVLKGEEVWPQPQQFIGGVDRKEYFSKTY